MYPSYQLLYFFFPLANLTYLNCPRLERRVMLRARDNHTQIVNKDCCPHCKKENHLVSNFCTVKSFKVMYYVLSVLGKNGLVKRQYVYYPQTQLHYGYSYQRSNVARRRRPQTDKKGMSLKIIVISKPLTSDLISFDDFHVFLIICPGERFFIYK